MMRPLKNASGAQDASALSLNVTYILKLACSLSGNYKICTNLCQPSFSVIFNAFSHYILVDLTMTFCYGTGNPNLRKGKK